MECERRASARLSPPFLAVPGPLRSVRAISGTPQTPMPGRGRQSSSRNPWPGSAGFNRIHPDPQAAGAPAKLRQPDTGARRDLPPPKAMSIRAPRNRTRHGGAHAAEPPSAGEEDTRSGGGANGALQPGPVKPRNFRHLHAAARLQGQARVPHVESFPASCCTILHRASLFQLRYRHQETEGMALSGVAA